MHIKILTIGRLKAGAEHDLAARYADRTIKSMKALGFRSLKIIEGDESTKTKEAEFLLSHTEGIIIALDETGETPTSLDFKQMLEKNRDAGTQTMTFIIGGAAGLAPELKAKAKLISFGHMTFPHQFVRIMLLEQLYRSMTMMSGHPYHKQ
jgi:23S rRNA (pseudouridine1915-N3)-methyltransferase